MSQIGTFLIEAYVEDGAKFLDKKNKNWYKNLDTSREVFDIHVTDKCVLGQLYGDFDKGVIKLLLSPIDTAHYGFALYIDSKHTREIYRKAWEKEVSTRLIDSGSQAR